MIRIVGLASVVLYTGHHTLHKSPPLEGRQERVKTTFGQFYLNLYLLQITTFGKVASSMGSVEETRLVVTSEDEN